MSTPEVFEAAAARHSDRELAIVTAALGLMAAAVLATFVLLPRGFGFLVLVIVFYPALQVVKRLLRPRRAGAPAIRIDDAGVEFGSTLRFRWRDVVEVEAGSIPRPGGRLAPDRVKLRLNRLAPVRPTAATLSAVGLEAGDGYFDVAIPPVYGLAAAEMADRFERRRLAAR